MPIGKASSRNRASISNPVKPFHWGLHDGTPDSTSPIQEVVDAERRAGEFRAAAALWDAVECLVKVFLKVLRIFASNRKAHQVV